MSRPMSAIEFSIWRKLAVATWRPRKDPSMTGAVTDKVLVRDHRAVIGPALR